MRSEGIALRIVLWLVLIIVLGTLESLAQVSTADVTGTVTDASGAVVDGVRVTAENLATRATRSAVSDSTGNYLIPLLPIGHYRLRAEKPGFRAWSVPEVTLAVNDRIRADVHLELGAIEQVVEVTSQTPALQSETSNLGTLVNSSFVADLPLNGRNFVRLAQVAVGANEGVPNSLSSGNRPDDRRRTSSVNVNGQQNVFNNFLVDGMDNNERSIGSIIVKPAMDALSEFKVQTNLYAAELGRTGGGVINLITKSGSNDLHGTLYEFFRNDKLDAKNRFDRPGPIPELRQNQFGGSVGGPIRKNKAFIFGDYEGYILRQAQTFVSTVPTLAMRSGNFAGLNTIFDPLNQRPDPNNPNSVIRMPFPMNRIPVESQDPVAQRLLALYPTPQTTGLANNFTNTPVKSQDDHTVDVRFDYNFSASDLFFARYTINDTTSFLPPHLPKSGDIEAGGEPNQFSGPALERAQSVHLNYVHTFSPNLVGEFKAGYARFALQTVPVNYGNNVSQQLGITNGNVGPNASGLTPMEVIGYRGLGSSIFLPIIVFNNTYQYVGNITWIRSGHTVKTGVDYRRRQFTVSQNPSGLGYFHFNANFTADPSGAPRTGDSVATFLLGLPFVTERRNHLVFPGMRTTDFASYVQDDWHVNRWLTLNVGVRYEFFTPFTEVADRIANPDLVTGRILIAGRNGVSRTAGINGNYLDFAPRFGFAARMRGNTVLRGGFAMNFFPGNYASGAHLRTPPFVSVFRIDTPLLTPVNKLRDGLPVPSPADPANPPGQLQAVAPNWRDSYVEQFNLTLQKEIFSGLVGSVGYVGALGRKQPAAYDANLALPGPGPVLQRRVLNRLFPSAGTIQLLDSFGVGNYHSLQSTIEYRLKHGLNFMGNYTYSRSIDNYPPFAGGKPNCCNWYPQLLTNRHLERGNSDSDLRHRFVLAVNYELGVGSNLKGAYAVIGKGWHVNAGLLLQTGLPFTIQNASARSNTGIGNDRPNRIANGVLPSDQRGVARYFDTAAFVPQPLFTIGNESRTPLYGPGAKNLDLSVGKDFRFKEKYNLQFKSEFFNLSNTPNYGLPQVNLGASDFGTINNTANYTSRQIQFSLRLLF